MGVSSKDQSVERLTAMREVVDSIPGAGPILRVLKQPRNEETAFSLSAVVRLDLLRGGSNHKRRRHELLRGPGAYSPGRF